MRFLWQTESDLRRTLLRRFRNIWTTSAMVGLCGLGAMGFAQESQAEEESVEQPAIVETITVGTRRLERSQTETPVPVDVVPVEELVSDSGQLDLGQLLQFTAPSFNSNRQSGSDGSDHVDAATLRGLGPDQVLVLINGKRRHTSSLVYLFGTRARGNVGTDLNTIPVSAIERIEILRDGAAAQYGSDAIAGVINIVLRKDLGLNAVASLGQYQEGDGDYGQAALNYGMELGNGGVLNLTGEFLTRDRTDRSGDNEPRIIGDAETENSILFFNLSKPVGDVGTFYGHGGLNARDGAAGAWYRDGVGSDDIPSRNSAEMYPDGFVPEIETDIEDYSAAFGFHGLAGAWFYDISTTYGSNRMEYLITQTLNASIATTNNGISPTEFDAGGFQFTQHTTNLDFSRFFPDVLAGVNVATGFEFRRETYEIFAGEPGSYADFDGAGGGNAGSQGFPGFQPVDEIDADRDNTALYLDVELQFSEKFLLAAAVRGEDYSDFGDTVNGKLALSYKASERIAFRGSVSTGFRAPSLHQRYFSSTFTDFIAGVAADVKLAPNESELARLVGIPSLKEETSENLTFGFTYTPRSELTITLDGYVIDIEDRIVLTGGFTAEDSDIGEIIDAQGLSEARFFTNAIDTSTEGVDLTIAHRGKLAGGNLNSFVAFNYNKTEVEEINTAPSLEGKEEIYFSTRERMFVEGSAPETKATLTFDYSRDRFGGNLKVAHFGDVVSGTWTQLDDPDSPPQSYDPATTVDLSFNVDLGRGVTWTFGGTNIFDTNPTRQDPNETENGAPWENVQMGINGSFFFTKFNLKM
ncbi:TonB-dependent receptor [Sulfidibacter corallicola]|uniref:TonB-dependent receptor n=1 Tax=Sulfidibacter corallicola TaxID=2818388 RepID=A0A8A4TJF0_SULCO|nr:TonB-dependent receptor [Sulfidibacter corallicola]QTD49282.1 TonB-dependent receptor [Sulfidibacter corallicola]